MSKLLRIVKRNKIAKEWYRKLAAKTAFSSDGIIRALPKYDNNNPFRANLILLGINEDEVFGGVSTAIKVLNSISKKLSCESRIIISGNQTFSTSTYVPEGFTSSDGSLFFLEENQNLPVGRNDFFIFTYWSTWFSLEVVLNYIENNFTSNRYRNVYLIQDFEPGFFSWSTEYLLAESTYRNRAEDTIALINSNELSEFISNRNYHFFSSHAFTPMLNSSLKDELFKHMDHQIKREKFILIYGRPSASRNAFELLVSALRHWSDSYASANEWQIISLGEKHDSIQLANNVIVSYGKVSLEEYASLMLRSYAGISLMASPHPSYPPLEMSTFGVKVITNKFENKDLSGFSQNLYSVGVCTPEVISSALSKICDTYSDENSFDNVQICCPVDYLSLDNFEHVINDVCVEISDEHLHCDIKCDGE